MSKHRARSIGRLWVLPALAIPLAVSSVAWASHVSSEGDEIAPNVTFAGVDVSRLDPDAAAAHVGWREIEFLETPLTIDLGERDVTLTAGELGFDYLYGDTLHAIVTARHGDGPVSEFVAWASTPFDPVVVEDRYTLDGERARQRLSRDDFVLEFPVEPELRNEDGAIDLVPGVNGLGVDTDELVERLADSDVASGPIEMEAPLAEIAPQVTDDAATSVADRFNELTGDHMVVGVGGTTARLSPEEQRRHISGEVIDGEMTVSIDLEGFQDGIEALFPEPIEELEKPVLEVADGRVEVVAKGAPPEVCCSAESVETAAEDLLDGGQIAYLLDTRPSEDETQVAWADGSHVKETVAEFTTFHGCCENRVTNIQTIADTLTGYYMLPGETLSVNDYVGVRTREDGYLPAGAIRGGHMTDEVGGGISQFATTLFNAAFYGGLDLDEYQSHTVYFSRYPFGREATLSMPGPDLVLTNSTDYPVLIWPSYTGTSITVTLYSTENVEVSEVGPRVSYRNQCRHTQIDREREYSDGRVVVDTIVANYRPGDGIDCNGNPIPEH